MSGEIPFHAAGNLTRDPELRWTAEGKPVASLAMAVTPAHSRTRLLLTFPPIHGFYSPGVL
jgi:hypothetical protein